MEGGPAQCVRHQPCFQQALGGGTVKLLSDIQLRPHSRQFSQRPCSILSSVWLWYLSSGTKSW